jgi:hypothetical protein
MRNPSQTPSFNGYMPMVMKFFRVVVHLNFPDFQYSAIHTILSKPEWLYAVF